MLKGAIFDFDGTIVDSMYIWKNIGMDYIHSLGIEPQESLNEIFAKFSLEEAAEYYRKNCGVTLSANKILNGVNEMISDFYQTKVTLKKGIKEYIHYLCAQDVKMCIATLSDVKIVKETLCRLGIAEYFSETVTCKNGKTTPDIYRTALAHLGTENNETCVFEDSCYAAKTAKKDGFYVVGVFDEYESEQHLLAKISDVYIKDYSDKVLKSL